MNKKLLYKTQRVQFYYLLLLFVIVTPTFYIVAHHLYVEEIDESLMLAKMEFLQHSISKLKTDDIENWNKFNDKIKIEEYQSITHDTLYNALHYNFLEKEDEPLRVLKTPIIIDGKSYTLSLRINLLESEEFISTIIILFVSILLLLILGILIINRRMSKRLWKPFYNTLLQIEQFEIDKHNKPILGRSDIEEFNRLNKNIEELISRNILIYNNQREFVENAAHELQTPIAVFKAKIDTLIQRDDITEGQAEVLVSLNESTSRLSKLNKNLLLLSKIENQQFSQKEEISISKLINNQLVFFEEQAIKKNIIISTDFQKDILINAHPGLTEILISNLLLNAIRHNVNDGRIIISSLEQTLNISNTGKPGKLLEDKLFSRFYKANTSNQGNGLGLAIVKKIADLNNWTISYSYSKRNHSFVVHF